MLNNKMHLSKYDPELWSAIEKEKIRQEQHIELIASENYTSYYVMHAQGLSLIHI
jgi:glycine hydroxymethyltransferase